VTGPMLSRGPWQGPRGAAAAGAVAGLAGGALFGATAVALHLPPLPSTVLRGPTAALFALELVLATALGAGFGPLIAEQRTQPGETVFWGLLYGALWWFLGPLTLLPLLGGRPVAWELAAARANVPILFGLLLYGGITAVVFAVLRRAPGVPRSRQIGPPLRGLAAGMIVPVLLYGVLDMMGSVPLGSLFGVGVVAGLAYPALFGAHDDGAGPALVRGTAYGFVCWIVFGLTLSSMLRAGTVDWSQNAAMASVSLLPTYLLLGAGIALVFSWLGSVARALFADNVRLLRVESPGAWGLRATLYGALAGLAGGAVFTVVMILVDELPLVAEIVGAHSAATGLIVHLIIAQLIGISYAVLFRRRSFDLASGVGWGVCYGFFWWVLGNLTLLPLLTGDAPSYAAAALAAGFPSLVGHLGYGAVLGALYYRMEERINPWWFTRNDTEARRISAARDQVLGSSPALWALTILIALTIPIILSG
jgi:uncharacterized membrane protein YagU involved in acid resistance